MFSSSGNDKSVPDKKRILIIEDNAETQLILKIYLRDFYEIHSVTTAIDGLNKIRENKYSLIVLDINLPGEMNGSDLILNLKNDPEFKSIPILVVTAYALKGDRENYLAMGANGYLAKPVDRKDIINSVKELIQN